jgi:hypothetical protein
VRIAGPRDVSLPAPEAALRRWMRLGAMPARERLMYYFVSVVQRAERQGISHPPSDTPLELERRIVPHLGEAGGDMDHLTQGYLEARYSTHPITAEQAALSRPRWEHVRSALRRIAHPSQ